MWNTIQSLSTGYLGPATRQVTDRVADGIASAIESGVSLTPEIVYNNERWETPLIRSSALAGTGSALIPELSSWSSSSSSRPRKRLRGNDWLRISPSPAGTFGSPTFPSGSSTLPASLYSQGLRKGNRWVNNLKWFRTRLLLRSRSRRRNNRRIFFGGKPTTVFGALQHIRKRAKQTDALQRQVRALRNSWRTSEFKYKLKRLARAKKLLHRWRRNLRRYGQ